MWKPFETFPTWTPTSSRPHDWTFPAAEGVHAAPTHESQHIPPHSTMYPSAVPFSPQWADPTYANPWHNEHRVQSLEERVQRLEKGNETSKERLQNIDSILNTVTSVNTILCNQLNTAHAELKKFQEVDKQTRALQSALGKIFDRIDPVITALIKITRDSNPNAVLEYDEDFKAFLEMSE